MADTKISQDPLITSFTGVEDFPIVQTLVNKRANIGSIWTVNETAVAAGTGSQASSQVFNYRTSLWNGSAPVQGWASWKLSASSITNLSQSLDLYFSQGSSPTLITPTFQLLPNGTLVFKNSITHTIGPNAGGGFSGGVNDFGINASIGTGFGFAQNGAVKLYYSNIGVFSVIGSGTNSNFNHSAIATADGDAGFFFQGTLTTRNIASEALYGVRISHTLNVNAGAPAGQILTGLLVNPSFTGSATFLPFHVQSTNLKSRFTNLGTAAGGIEFYSNSTSLSASLTANYTTGEIAVKAEASYYLGFYANGQNTHLITQSANGGLVNNFFSLTTATSTATQVGSVPTSFRSSLWNGSAAVVGWYSWRVDASTAANLAHSLNLFTSTGSTPSFGTPVFSINQAGQVWIGGITASVGATHKLEILGRLAIQASNGVQGVNIFYSGAALYDSATSHTFRVGGATQVLDLGLNMNFSDGVNIVFTTTNGSKIGGANNQKLSLWGVTPDVQPTNGIAAAAFVANTSGIANDSATYGGYTGGQIVAALKRLGALA